MLRIVQGEKQEELKFYKAVSKPISLYATRTKEPFVITDVEGKEDWGEPGDFIILGAENKYMKSKKDTFDQYYSFDNQRVETARFFMNSDNRKSALDLAHKFHKQLGDKWFTAIDIAKVEYEKKRQQVAQTNKKGNKPKWDKEVLMNFHEQIEQKLLILCTFGYCKQENKKYQIILGKAQVLEMLENHKEMLEIDLDIVLGQIGEIVKELEPKEVESTPTNIPEESTSNQ